MGAPAQSTSLVIALGTVLLFGACDERPQTASTSRRKDDAPAHKGTEGDSFMTKNWTPDGRTGQENQIHACGQYQNEYNEMP